MASLCLVDFGITGIFIAVSGRIEVAIADLVANLCILGVLNLAVAFWLYRPVQSFLAGKGDAGAARRRIRRLPVLSSFWAAAVTLIYCAVAFSLGVFMPQNSRPETLPGELVLLAMSWFGFVYAVYYSFYIYFLISDYAASLKRYAFETRQLIVPPSGGRIAHKLLIVFFVLAVVPNLLIILDLTAFRDLRAAQGLGITQTILLDLLASLLAIGVSFYFVARSLLRPVRRLMAAVSELKHGNLDVYSPVTADDEIGVLTESFNDMVGGLRERAAIREAFGKYVPERVAAEIISGRSAQEPTLVTATVLYADIEGFTSLVEDLPPGRVLQILNEYFTSVIEPITREGGVVTQFQGDALLVTFNVPQPAEDHADRAVRAALAIQEVLRSRRFAGVSIRSRIGINSGELVAGSVGSGDRLIYTVHGDVVNVAARLEQLNKEHGTRILLSSSTTRRLMGTYPLRPVGRLVVRGKAQPVQVFELSVQEGKAREATSPSAADAL